jgi:flagellar protein FlbD
VIALQRLNGQPFVLNCDLIETVESTPDTVIKLTSGKTLVVINTIEDIVRKTVKYRQLCGQAIQIVNKSKEVQA